MADRQKAQTKPRLLQVLNRMATKTFALDYTNSDTFPALPPSTSYRTELSTWLLNESALARYPKTVCMTGRMRLAVVDFNPALWIRNGSPESYMLKLLCTLQIPQTAYTKDDVVISHIFPPELDEHSSVPSTEVVTQSVACNTSGIAWKFYHQSLTTVGVAWSIYREGRQEIDYVLHQATQLRFLLLHPSLLSLLGLQAMTISMRQWIHSQQLQVMQAQLDSGYHKYARLMTGKQANNIDFGELSASVSGLSANIVTSEICLQGLHDLALSIIEENTSFADDRNANENDRIQQVARYVDRQAKYWAKECAFLQHEAASWQRKASIVIQGIFNLIAQRDQNTSISIARDSKILAEQSQTIAYESRILAEKSKRDSASMKAIAAVTMFFLPGTFVAV